MKRGIPPLFFFLLAVFAAPALRGQTINLLYGDIFGVQPVVVDTMSPSGKKTYFRDNAGRHFALGLHMFGLSEKRKIHFGFLVAYRQVSLENLNLLAANNVNRYEKEWFVETLFGPTYFSRHPLVQTNNFACHFSLEALGGLQANTQFAIGANLAGGFCFLNKKSTGGLAIQFVYRPVPFDIENRSEAFSPDPYYVQLGASYSLRVAFCFGRNIEYLAAR